MTHENTHYLSSVSPSVRMIRHSSTSALSIGAGPRSDWRTSLTFSVGGGGAGRDMCAWPGCHGCKKGTGKPRTVPYRSGN